jgi:hypothetical protein
MLFKIADSYNKPGMTYPILAELNYGSKGVTIVKSLLVAFQVGCCVGYFIFFIKFFENSFNTIGNKTDDIVYLILALCIILPMSLINNIALFVKVIIIIIKTV